MATINVGGVNVFQKRAKTLEEAINMAMDNDTIKIHKHHIVLKNGISINKSLYIEGGGATISVASGKMGFNMLSGSLHMKDATFMLGMQNNGICFQSSYFGKSYFDNVNFKHAKTRMRETFPSISAAAPSEGVSGCELHFTNCKIDNMNVNVRSIELTNCEVGKFYKMNSVVFGDNMAIKNLTSANTYYSSGVEVDINKLTTPGQIMLNGKFNIDKLDVVRGEFDKGNGKLAKNGAAVKMINDYVENNIGPKRDIIINCLGSDKYRSDLTIGGVNLSKDEDSEKLVYERAWFNIRSANLIIDDSEIARLDYPSMAVSSTIAMQSVSDYSDWQIKDVTLSNKDSDSQLFTKSVVRKNQEKTAQPDKNGDFGALAEIDSMIGLVGVKKQVKAFIRNAKVNTELRKKGIKVSGTISYHTVLAGNAGSGKAENVDNLIHTPDGIRRFGDLKPGDFVFDRLGLPTQVTAIFPQGQKMQYKVTLEDGRSMICNDEHIFAVHDQYKHRKLGAQNMTLREMLDKGIEYRVKSHGKYTMRKHWAVPNNEAVEMPTKNLPFDPYALGAFIGDGSLCERDLRISSDDPFVVQKVARRLNVTAIKYKSNNYSWNFKYYEPVRRGRYVHSIVHMQDVIPSELQNVKSIDRFIPQEYKNADIAQRWDLINGLFDTDGTIKSKETGHSRYSISYSTSSKKLADDIREVLFSLGIGSTLTSSNRQDDIHHNTEYKVYLRIKPEDKPRIFTLPRKKHVAKSAAKQSVRADYDYIKIDKVECLNQTAEMMCIMVDNPEHLYLSNEYIVTHNTAIARLIAQALYENGVLKTNKFTEVQGGDLVAGYVGQTAPKTRAIVERALDGVLFIDEAYVLTHEDGNTFKDEAVAELLKDIDDHRDRIVCILAGYTPNMRQFFAKSNPGLTSRFANWINFPDYTPKEMLEIMLFMINKKKLHIADKDTAMTLRKMMMDQMGHLDANSGNGRFVRNALEKIELAKNSRIGALAPEEIQKMSTREMMTITKTDVVNGMHDLAEQQTNMNGLQGMGA